MVRTTTDRIERMFAISGRISWESFGLPGRLGTAQTFSETALAGQVQFLLHRAAPVSTTTPESISPTATQSNPVVFAPVTGSARPNWVGSTEGTKSVGVGDGAWPGSSAPRIGRTGSTSQVMVPVLEAKPPPDALVTEACTLSFPRVVPLYVKVALPLTSVVAVPVTPALGPLRLLKST